MYYIIFNKFAFFTDVNVEWKLGAEAFKFKVRK